MSVIKLLVCGFVLLLLTGCNIINQIKMRYANDDIVPQWPSNTASLKINTRYLGEKPYVEVSINGQNGFLFLIDTGASLTYLMDSPKVKQLALHKGNVLQSHGWGDEGSSETYQSHIQSLSLKQVEFQNVSVVYLPASKSPYFLRQDEVVFDGVLGHDILKHFSWTFDGPNQQVSIAKHQHQPANQDIPIPFDISMSKLAIDSVIHVDENQSFEQELLIDTGSRHYLKINQVYIDDEGIKLPKEHVIAADFGLSGKAIHQRVTLDKLQLGSFEVEQIKANVMPSDDDDNHWVIGSALLNQYVSVIDYKTETLYIRQTDEQHFTSKFNQIGLELRKLRSGEFVNRFTMSSSPLANSGIEVGDVITSINQTSTKDISQTDWLTITNAPGNYQICIQRQAQCFDIKSQHIKGYSTSQ